MEERYVKEDKQRDLKEDIKDLKENCSSKKKKKTMM